MINFTHFTKKYSRAVLAFVVLVMVIPLVLWGYMSPDPDEKLDSPAGYVYGNQPVSMGVFNAHRRKAIPAYWWRQFQDPMAVFRIRQFGQQPPTEAALAQVAWENILLLQEAERLGLSANESELARKEGEVYRFFVGPRPYDSRTFQQIAERFFQARVETVQEWIHDLAVIDKLLGLVEESEFAPYEKVYDEVLRGQTLARAWIASFDPKNYARDLKPVRMEEVAKYYEKNKERFRVPDKVVVSYLLLDLEDLKKRAPDPAEDEIKKYYDNNPAEFRKPHEHQPGEVHREDEKPEYKPLDEVRAEIASKLKTDKAKQEGRKITSEVNRDIGATHKDGKIPENVFDLMKDKYKAQGIALAHDVTTSFDVKHVDDVEKAVGTGSRLSSWAFEKNRKEGDIIDKADETSKGFVFYRIQRKVDSYVPNDLTEPVRERIVKVLQKEQLRKRTQQAATTVVQEITANGFAAARRKFAAEWQPTKYFRHAGETGLADATLSREVASRAAGGQLKPGKAEVLQGTREKPDWAHAVYLEDAISVPPENPEFDFHGARSRLNEQAQRDARAKYIKNLYAEANVKDLVTKAEPKAGEGPEAPPVVPQP